MAVVAEDPQKQLEWEARQRPRAGIAAMVVVVTAIAQFWINVNVYKDAPNPSGIETLQRALKPGAVADLPSLLIPRMQYLDDRLVQQALIGAWRQLLVQPEHEHQHAADKIEVGVG